MGVGDRFGRQAAAQLQALQQAAAMGVRITPVWNKSQREHSIIGSAPGETRRAADAAVRACRWTGAYFVDADHIGLKTVDAFIDAADFFTLDVADWIGKAPEPAAAAAFVKQHVGRGGALEVPGVADGVAVTRELLEGIAARYLAAVAEAGRIYRHIAQRKAAGTFVTEVSMDECAQPQTPVELYFILGALAAEGVPAQTIAPKFSGSFFKGIDYRGDVERFAREFEEDLAVIAQARRVFALPAELKVSVHSGSDKFSLYPIMRQALRRHKAGLHLKTAGTTWLEEVIGLAHAGGAALQLVKDVYQQAYQRRAELCAPYAAVIDIAPERLPRPAAVRGWSGEEFAAALEHDAGEPRYNEDFRQLLHVGYKVAAEIGERYTAALAEHEKIVALHVADNLFTGHIHPLFIEK